LDGVGRVTSEEALDDLIRRRKVSSFLSIAEFISVIGYCKKSFGKREFWFL